MKRLILFMVGCLVFTTANATFNCMNLNANQLYTGLSCYQITGPNSSECNFPLYAAADANSVNDILGFYGVCTADGQNSGLTVSSSPVDDSKCQYGTQYVAYQGNLLTLCCITGVCDGS